MARTAGIIIVLSWITVSFWIAAPHSEAQTDDCSLAAAVVTESYVDGLWRKRDATAVRGGFHPGFVLQVLDEGRLLTVDLDQWLDRLALDGEPNEQPVESDVRLLDCTGSIATVKVELFEAGEHLYTDHFELYHFPEGWKIVAKVFHDQSP